MRKMITLLSAMTVASSIVSPVGRIGFNRSKTTVELEVITIIISFAAALLLHGTDTGYEVNKAEAGKFMVILI